MSRGELQRLTPHKFKNWEEGVEKILIHIEFPEHNVVDLAAEQATLFTSMTGKSLLLASDYKNHCRSLIPQT